ncbi:MAG: ABC transporter ATP-binding protein [Acidimicrobiia bacterium]
MLHIKDLSVRIGPHEIVRIEELHIERGQRLGLVGESGSGKTMTAMTIAGLQPREATIAGSVTLDGQEVVGRSQRQLAVLRGADIGVIFQDPLRALNPMMRVGRQIGEAVRLHDDLSRSEVRSRVLDLLEQVQLGGEDGAFHRRYPHQLSGGQRQRVLIAIAIASRPKLLIADEPTTALDVTVQKGILDLIVGLSEEREMATLFVSHDLGVVRSVSHRMAVMYGGHIVEVGPRSEVVLRSRHRYTEALIAANPGKASSEDLEVVLGEKLQTIAGSVPPLGGFPSGCRFRGRCEYELDTCATPPPVTEWTAGHRFKCWNPAAFEEDRHGAG